MHNGTINIVLYIREQPLERIYICIFEQWLYPFFSSHEDRKFICKPQGKVQYFLRVN